MIMKPMTLSYFLRSFIVPLAMICTGCSNSDSPGTKTTIVIPAKGSFFVEYSTITDSSGKLISSDTTVKTIIATGLTVDSKTDVIEFVTTLYGTVIDSSYGHYESNGDISTKSLT